MKFMFRAVALAFAAFSLSSCCGFMPCAGKGPEVTKDVTVYEDVQREISVGSSKGGLRTETITEQVAVTKTVTEEAECGKCLSTFCPTKGCCGTTGKEVIRRATAQNSTGNPHIGLIPTMRPLVD